MTDEGDFFDEEFIYNYLPSFHSAGKFFIPSSNNIHYLPAEHITNIEDMQRFAFKDSLPSYDDIVREWYK